MTNIRIIGTEPFQNDYSGDPEDKKNEIKDYVSNRWSAQIEQNGNYTANIYVNTDNEVPSKKLPDTTLSDRLAKAEDWLTSQWLLSADSCIIVDYWGGEANTYGWGYIGTAGGSEDNAGLVDVHHEDNNNLPAELDHPNGKSKAVGLHECLHTYDAQHPGDVKTFDTDTVSNMYSWDGTGCADNGSPNVITKYLSNCTVQSVRNYL